MEKYEKYCKSENRAYLEKSKRVTSIWGLYWILSNTSLAKLKLSQRCFLYARSKLGNG